MAKAINSWTDFTGNEGCTTRTLGALDTDVIACIAAAEISGTAPIVRPVSNKPEIIAPFLDRGAWGVQVSHGNTAEEARAAVDAVKYAPEGHRGIYGQGRPAIAMHLQPNGRAARAAVSVEPKLKYVRAVRKLLRRE